MTANIREQLKSIIERVVYKNSFYNDKVTRDKILEELSKVTTASKYKIICDETNNTPDMINSRKLVVDISQANKSITIELKNRTSKF